MKKHIINNTYKMSFLSIFIFFFVKQFFNLLKLDVVSYLPRSFELYYYTMIIILLPLIIFIIYYLPALVIIEFYNKVWVNFEVIEFKEIIRYSKTYRILTKGNINKRICVYRC